MYFLVCFAPTGERAIYQNHGQDDMLTVKHLLKWIHKRFHFESSTGETGNRRLSLIYDCTELDPEWFLRDIGIQSGSTVKCMVKEDRIPDYRFFLPIRNEMFDVFDSSLHPIETTIMQMRIAASHMSGLPLSAFRLITDSHVELFDHVTLSQYDIEQRSTLTIQTWIGWSDFFTYARKGYTKAVLKLLNQDELVKQYMLQVALYIASHYGNVDLARALLQLGARADRPVGHHPSRQWCSSTALHPEYFRCAIHEAIACQQVGIVLLFGSRDVAILQTADGYGIKPWRLALRQPRSVKQREVALFILTKQFGGVRISNKVTVPQRHVYKFKQWADRARERVYIKRGIQLSSLKRKPLVRTGESMLGYKTLIDGYNNDFQDYYSTAAYAKEKLRPACVVLNERERIKTKHMEFYMKNFSVTDPVQVKIVPPNVSPMQQSSSPKGPIPKIITPPLVSTSLGKKLWTKVANMYRLETFLLRNAIDLIDAGLLTDQLSQPSRQVDTKMHLTTGDNNQSRLSSSLSSSSSTNLYVPLRIRLFATRFRLIKEMMYNPDKDGRTLRHLSGVEWTRVTRGDDNAWHTQRASTAVIPAHKGKQTLNLKKQKAKQPKKPTRTELPEIHGGEASSAKIPLPKEFRKVDYRFILRADDTLHHEIMYEWERAARLTLPSLAVQSMNEASKFKRKSWIRQVNMGIQFSVHHSRRTFEGIT